MFVSRISILSILLSAAICGIADDQDIPKSWEGPLMKPVERENVFAFTAKPSFKKTGKDRYEATFASKGKCDVAVAVEDGNGRILRHLAAGVLGANAPAPLQKNSLSQTLVWDGKDDCGKYVDSPETCRVRVSLGMNPKFDKLIGWHPDDIVGPVCGMGADEDGVYILSTSARPQIKKFDHDGNYAATVMPWPADMFNAGKVLGKEKHAGPDGHAGPNFGGMFGGMLPIGNDSSGPIFSSIPINKGRMLFCTRGGRHTKKIVRLGTDGTTRGESMEGPQVCRTRGDIYGENELAISPDGKWIYLCGLGQRYRNDGWNVAQGGDHKGGQGTRHAIYRLGWNDKGGIGQPFIGEEGEEKHARGKDNRHFDSPSGLACDEKGRLYVSDTGNDRIQVFGPDGTYLKTIPCKEPWQLAVHHKTGEIYVHCYPNRGGDRRARGSGFQARICKFGPFDNPRKILEWKIPNRAKDPKYYSPKPSFCLDSWTSPARVWITNWGAVEMYEETGQEFKQVAALPDRVRAAGYQTGKWGTAYRNRLAAVPGSYLYMSKGKTAADLQRIDPEDGKTWQPVYTHWSGIFEFDELVAGADGLMYARGVPFIARLREPTYKWHDGVSWTPEDEVPFDYGVVRKSGTSHSYRSWWNDRGKNLKGFIYNQAFRGVVLVPSVPGGNYENMGVNVSPKGDLIVYAKTYARNLSRKELGLNEVAYKNYVEYLKANQDGNLPMTPGVLNAGEIVYTYDKKGEPIGEAVIAGSVGSCGVAMDKEGNIYAGVGMAPVNPPPYTWGGRSGVVLKFPPKGGKIYGSWGPMGLSKDAFPKRPPEFTCDPAAKLWSQNMFWSIAGVGEQTPVISPGCTCPQSRIRVDTYGRLFAPMAWRFCIAVVDGNGNPITYVGRYGNSDSGLGPQSKVKVPGGIALAFCSFICQVSDKWLYMNDSGNYRIVRAKIAYETEETVSMQ